MTVEVAVLEVPQEGEPEPLGRFAFLELPSSGDTIALQGPSGESWDVFRVLYVAHNPVKLPRVRFSQDSAPWVAIYVQLTGIK